ncbi:MAG: phosphate/phosphite/phosphonate ABC transporter substrate-binding protein [Verrucomicrobia bacterium]|nr:phosphate/phosphite/phosphonate ABC transporter substrate-binding protein [Verrucomicrobiota bacterium]
MFRTFLSAAGFLALTLCASLPAQTPKKLVVALKPDKNPDQMVAERAALTSYLEKELKQPVEVIIPLSGAVIQEGFANGTIDLGYLSATDLLTARGKGTATLLLAGEIDGKTTYQSYWVTLKEKPYTKVEDLKGQRVAFASRTSTSGFVLPLWDLHQRKLVSAAGDPEEFFGKGNVFFGTGYVSAIEKVFTGEAEAAAVSYYVLDKDKHLTAEQRAKLRKLAEQGPVPTHVLAVRKSLPAAEVAALKAALLKMNEPATAELRDKLFTSKLVESDEARHLGTFAEASALAAKVK